MDRLFYNLNINLLTRELSALREKIFDIIEMDDGDNILSKVYDYIMIFVIGISIVPLAFKTNYPIFSVIDQVCVVVFIIDYALRLMTADYKLKKGLKSFFLYPFTFMALIDLLCILPSFHIVGNGVRVLKVLRMLRAFRAIKFIRYSRSLNIILGVIRKQKKPLLAVCTLAVGYIFIAALIVFNIEPDTFDSFFDSLYWATISLTTLGYGDIYPVSVVGRFVTMVSTLVGMAIVALPSGIVTAGYIHELNINEDPEGALDNLEGYVKL